MQTFSGGGEGLPMEARIHSKMAMGIMWGILMSMGAVALLGVMSGEKAGDALAQCFGPK